MKKKKATDLVVGENMPEVALPIEEGQGLDGADDFIRVEKNLVALGFFTPTSKGSAGKLKTTRVKTVSYMGTDEEKRPVRKLVKIITGGIYGLPGTADLDKWLAFMKLVNTIHRRDGLVTNPISFTSYELLSLLGMRRDGRENFDAVVEWVSKMKATTIEFVGEKGVPGQRRKGIRSVSVFDDRVSRGEELKGGGLADKNYVWLSTWQLNSINDNYLIPIDFETYRALKKPIAKTLVPLLQIYLYASRADNFFTKGYAELCQLLGIREWKYEGDIKDQLSPSLDELRDHGYLAGWGVEKRKGVDGFKIVFRHGEKFHRDHLLQISRQGQLTPAGFKSEEETTWLWMLVERGITEAKARQLISRRAPGQQIGDQVEWIDHIIRKRGVEHYDNPPGFYIALIQTDAPIDPNFETSRMRRLREEYEARRREDEMRAGPPSAGESEATPEAEESPRKADGYELYLLQSRYDEYKRRERGRHLRELSAERRGEVMDEAMTMYEKKYAAATKVLRGEVAEGIILGIAEEIIEPDVEVISFEEFAAQS